MRRFDLSIAVKANIPPTQIIAHDQQDVGRLRLRARFRQKDDVQGRNRE